jgi:hypothetical protein
VYGWIWRHLPFGRTGKIIGSLLLVSVAVAALWYAVFPWAEPLLPFDDVQVTDGGAGDVVDPADPADPGGAGDEEPTGDEHELPYSTASNNPEPSASAGR